MLILLSIAFATPPAPSASSTVTAGPWTIAGLDGQQMHTHGGRGADLGHARFRVVYAGEDPALLTVTQVEDLTGSACDQPPEHVRSTPQFGGLFVESGSMRESVRTLTVHPGTLELTVGFEAVEAYMAWCDRYASRVTFDAGGVPLVVVAETWVTREEPMRMP